MAITTTTLAAAMAATDMAFAATSATGATVGGLVKIDNEWMAVTAITGTTIDVRSRGSYATKAVAHNKLAPVLFCLQADLPDIAPGQSRGTQPTVRDVVSYSGATDAIALPTRDTVALLTNTVDMACTLANPEGVPDGTFLTIVCVGTPASTSHTVTLATGLLGGTTADILTFGTGALGTSVTLAAYKGLWAGVGWGLLANETLSPTVSSSA